MLPAMFGKATLAIELSSTSRIVANMTATAISHGLALGVHAVVWEMGEASCDIDRSLGEVDSMFGVRPTGAHHDPRP
jgi:hypothetical protein